MSTVLKKIIFASGFLFAMATMWRCKEAYVSPHVSPATGYLVVEGYVSGNTTTSFRLSRSIGLSSDSIIPQETGAVVQVEGSDNSVYPLADQGAGLYTSLDTLSLVATAKYRLRVRTQSGGEYLSDYAVYKITPAIDSINWVEDNGVTVYANTHDDAGNTRYYQWNYDEAWEYHSAEQSGYEYVAATQTFIFRPLQDQIYRCWRSGSSTGILISSTAKLSKDVVYEQPLREIPANSEPLGVLYSILVRQYALTDSGYNYLSLMKQNTESLGTIFDAQPSTLTGNIHCLTNSGEPVVGWVSAGTANQQRIFISNFQLRNWSYAPDECPIKDTVLSGISDVDNNFGSGLYTPIDNHLTDYISNFTSCVDCTKRGGTTVEPSFWPN